MKTKQSSSKWAGGQGGGTGAAPEPLHVSTFCLPAEQMDLPEFCRVKPGNKLGLGSEMTAEENQWQATERRLRLALLGH